MRRRRGEWRGMGNISIVWAAIDDTDNLESIGTGRLARDMASAVEKIGLAMCPSVTRHQLLVAPEIPYTSHNSSACLELLADLNKLAEIIRFCVGYLRDNYHEGADPGLCVAIHNGELNNVTEFGRLAQREIVTTERAYQIAGEQNIHLSAHGGTGLGVIGALAAVGLRSAMNDGRFLELKGIRDIDGVLRVDEILAMTAIKRICAKSGEELGGKQRVDTRGWVRPDLKDGLATLVVEEAPEGIWRTLKSKNKKGDEK